jgi:hypothetical protein
VEDFLCGHDRSTVLPGDNKDYPVHGTAGGAFFSVA